MIFSIDNINKQENIIDNAPINKNVIKIYENSSLFIDALHYIIEENILIENELLKYTSSTYTEKKLASLHEEAINIKINTFGSKVYDKVSDMFSKIKTNLTLENIVKFIIQGFFKLITRIWREFEILCMNIVNKSSQIRRLKSKIYNLGVPIEYKEPMFTYTHTLDDTKRTDLEEQLSVIYNDINSLITKISSIKTLRDVELAINEFNSSKSLDEDNYSNIRGELLGANNPIAEDDYSNALFKYFRNGSSTATIDNTISPDSIRERLELYDKAPKLIKVYSRDKDKLEKAGNNLVAKLERDKLDRYFKEVPKNLLDLYNDLVYRYASKIKNTCNIFILFYTQKLDAAKDELATNTKILFKAAQYIVREGL